MAIVPLSTSPYNQLIMIGALEYTEWERKIYPLWDKHFLMQRLKIVRLK